MNRERNDEPQFRSDFTYLRVELYNASDHEGIIELIFQLDNIMHRNTTANEIDHFVNRFH